MIFFAIDTYNFLSFCLVSLLPVVRISLLLFFSFFDYLLAIQCLPYFCFFLYLHGYYFHCVFDCCYYSPTIWCFIILIHGLIPWYFYLFSSSFIWLSSKRSKFGWQSSTSPCTESSFVLILLYFGKLVLNFVVHFLSVLIFVFSLLFVFYLFIYLFIYFLLGFPSFFIILYLFLHS